MPGVLDTTTTWMQVWIGYLNLASENPTLRMQAMQTLRDQGTASLFALRLALKNNDDPRRQFGAAVALHWLGQPEGMRTLQNVISDRDEVGRYRSEIKPEVMTHLEAAFITIGAPDSVTGLLEVWPSLPDWTDTHPYMQLICRLWQNFRDPRVLEALAARDLLLPRLFEETVATFGVPALPLLQRMTQDRTTPARRLLALATLRRIPGKDSFYLLTSLLRDPDPAVRSQAPEALEKVAGPIASCRALTEAILAGYSTQEAVNALWIYRPPDLEETLLTLIARYGREKGSYGNDTPSAILAALPVFTSAAVAMQSFRLKPMLCALLEPPTDPRVAASAARVLAERRLNSETNEVPICNALWAQLCELNRESRVEVAAALRSFGDPFGEQILALLADCRPKGGLLDTLNTMLRGGPEAGLAASRAMEQVTQWFHRISKETGVRLNGVNPAVDPVQMALQEPRLPERLRQMLDRVLDRLDTVWNAEELSDVMGVCVGLIRALVRLGKDGVFWAHDPLIRALLLVKYNGDPQFGRAYPGAVDYSEVGEMVREAAVSALLEFYGPDSLSVFLNALQSTRPPVQRTVIEALGRMGDVRALPALQPFAEGSYDALGLAAQNAIAAIKRTNPEMMTLLRASSSSDARPDTLLRPASGNPDTISSDLLLRPSSSDNG